MNPKLAAVAAKHGGVFSSAQAAECGYSPEQIRERLRDGRWERVRHGQYAEPLDLSRLAPWDQKRHLHRRRIHAVMNSKRTGTVAVSHQSALILHDLPVWEVGLAEVHVTRLDDQRGGLVGDIRHHRGKVAAGELTEVQGLVTTTVARAVAETACTTSFEAAVVIADAAFRRPQLSEAAVVGVLDVVEFWPGSPTARAALAFADRRSESVGESRLRVLMDAQGLPAPQLQAAFVDADGFVGRVDFYFAEQRTVVEFDGLVKYAGGSAQALVDEKRREDRLRALGVEVVRIVWSDLDRPADVALRIRQAFARAARRTA
jgi:very-short-patch-repair endonuclease